jgi:hypothetical protein
MRRVTRQNDRGEIAGWGRLANGEHRPFLLIPCHAADGDGDDYHKSGS